MRGWDCFPLLPEEAGPSWPPDFPKKRSLSANRKTGAVPSGTAETGSSDSLSRLRRAGRPEPPPSWQSGRICCKLRVRLGDDFFFPMTAKEASMEECRHDSLLSRAAELSRTPLTFDTLPGCPLPVYTVRSIEQLERQVIFLTESYSGQWSVYVKKPYHRRYLYRKRRAHEIRQRHETVCDGNAL